LQKLTNKPSNLNIGFVPWNSILEFLKNILFIMDLVNLWNYKIKILLEMGVYSL